MAIRPFNFYVEMEKNDYTPVGEVKQLDTMELDIKVLENSIPKNLESSEIALYVRKKDGTILEQKENISIVEASEGTIKIKVKNQATACAGMTLFELELKGADGIATTGTFIFVVNERVVNGEVVESKDEIHALVEVEKYVKLAKEELQRFKELQAEMLRTNETMNSQENLRNVAETERISAEEERKEKESERVESEGNRVAAEGLRANAESSRANAENSRERKERERVTAEVSRVDAEALRVSEEKKRVNAENSRANAEVSRIDAESVRVAEEKKRVTAETARAENEDARVLAEQNREENFSQFESKINKISSDMSKNTKELKNARTATTGEEFNSLDERIDCEVDRLNKKIDVTMLQQKDKENHTIENTVEGMTTDMVIKGRTLQNLIKNESYDLKSFPITLENNYFTFTTDGNFQFRNIISNEKNLVPSTEYTIIYEVKENTLSEGNYVEACNTTNFNSSVVIDSVTKPGIYSKRVLTKSQLDEAGHALYFNASMNNALGQILKLRVMLLKGNLTDIPNYFEGIKSFGQEENKISTLSTGKNLMPINISEQYGYGVTFNIDNNEKVTIKGTNEQYVGYDFRLNVVDHRLEGWGGDEPRQFYTDDKGYYDIDYSKDHVVNIILKNNKTLDGSGIIASLNVVYEDYSVDKIQFTKATSFYNSSIKLKKGLKIRGIFFGCWYSKQIYDLEFNIQLTEGTVAPNYYNKLVHDKKDISLQPLGFDEGLRGLNDSVYDELNDIRNVAIKRIGKHIFTGNENIRQLENNTKGLVVLIENIKGVDSRYFISNSNIGYEIRWNVNEWENNYPIAFNFKDSSAGSMSLLISKSKIPAINDVDSLKQYLRENNIELYYELKEPVETPLTEPINVKTFSEKTYVSFLNSLKGTNNFKAPVDTVLALSNLTDDIKNKTDKKEADEINERATESLELSEYNHSDINDNIFPYIMDLELMVLDMMELNGYTNKKYKISERAGIHMTSKQALERLIRQKKVTLEDVLDRIVRYNDAGRITDAEALELTDLAHEIL